MNCFVTGASGFISANLVHELVTLGHRVKALLRPASDLRGLAGVEFERLEGDVSDRQRLEKAMHGCDWCFHVAASYHLWLRDYAPMYAANVEGTRNVIEAAAAAGGVIAVGFLAVRALVLKIKFWIGGAGPASVGGAGVAECIPYAPAITIGAWLALVSDF